MSVSHNPDTCQNRQNNHEIKTPFGMSTCAVQEPCTTTGRWGLDHPRKRALKEESGHRTCPAVNSLFIYFMSAVVAVDSSQMTVSLSAFRGVEIDSARLQILLMGMCRHCG